MGVSPTRNYLIGGCPIAARAHITCDVDTPAEFVVGESTSRVLLALAPMFGGTYP